MAKDNKNLHNANKSKKDEFYTQLSDIENELRHYKASFNGKTVLCNCDDPYESNFVKYFAMNFNTLGLKKLIATSYATSPVVYTQLSFFGEDVDTVETSKKPYVIEITEVTDLNGDGAVDLQDFELMLKKNPPQLLKGDGDFRSDECIEFLKEADVVVTNPPFSLFREYVAQLIEYDKKFLIIGNQNAITYKEIFPLIKDNKMWLGYGFSGNVGFFINSHYEDYAKSSQHKEGMIRVSGVMWYTNLDTKKRHEDIILYRFYTPEDYPHYDNYDAIEVSKTAEIPCDYYDVMGVPITFMDKYNPEQFEIIGATESEGKGFSNGLWNEESKVAQPVINGERKYKRIFIKRKV
ncbi:MAG: adenine-specific methyltransferase EcoRI family protein [Ruminococcus sp.]|nr:adenine-specific methyltransferase EcoRI family protein [Ruminococcus sp.]